MLDSGAGSSRHPAGPPAGPALALPPAADAPAHSRGSMRKTVRAGVALILAGLLFRTFFAEPYLVPTGSMAPTVAGYHKVSVCPCCGCPVMVGRQGDGDNDAEAQRHYRTAICPNCGWEKLHLDQVPECPGDRLFVHKHVYDFRAPRRWEMIVFRHPQEQKSSVSDTYIKRVVGLPGESVQIHRTDGDVYVNGRVARKTLAEFRALRLPVFDNNYLPHDAPMPFRWQGFDGSGWKPEDAGRQFRLAASAGADEYDWLFYRHLVRQVETGGRLVWRPDHLKDVVGYNGGHPQERLIHDVLLDCEVQARGNGWLALAFTDGHEDVLVEIPVGAQAGSARLFHAAADGGHARPALLRATAPFRLAADAPARVECGVIDRRVFVAIDGAEIFGTIDLLDPPTDRPRRALQRPLTLGGYGPVSCGGRGVELLVRDLRLFRDIHYTDGSGGELHPHGVRDAVTLGPGEYFVLGDNSVNSYDSRCWKGGPVVRHTDLVGKAFLLHLPTRMTEWHQFGEKRALAVPDWSRMKLLR